MKVFRIFFITLALSYSSISNAAFFYDTTTEAAGACQAYANSAGTYCWRITNEGGSVYFSYSGGPQFYGTNDDCDFVPVGGLCAAPTPQCSDDPSGDSCGNPNYSGGSVTNEDGSITDTINECYDDGSCNNSSSTVTSTTDTDGSNTTTTTTTTSTTNTDGSTTDTETSSTSTKQTVETSDNGTKLTESTTSTDSGGGTQTVTTTTSSVINDDGSKTITVTSETSTGTTTESYVENPDGSKGDSVDCSDIAYINNPICRSDSFEDNTSTGCGDYGLSVIGENRCVASCPSGYISYGNTCTKTNDSEVAPDDTNQTSNDLLTRISKTLDQSKGIQEQIRNETKNVVDSVQNNTNKVVDAINGIEVTGGGGGSTNVEVNIPEQTGGGTWAKTGSFRAFDHAAIDADIVQAKQDLKNIFTSIRSDMSAIFGEVNVSASAGCSTSFEAMGQIYSFCVMDYKDQLSQVGLAMMAIAYLLAFVIIVRN